MLKNTNDLVLYSCMLVSHRISSEYRAQQSMSRLATITQLLTFSLHILLLPYIAIH